MPSQQHEVLVDLFRHRPQLAPQLMREVLDVPLPPYTDVEVGCADLTEVQPTEYRADLVLSLSNGASKFGIIVEVQLARDDRKRFVWPAYLANLRAVAAAQGVTMSLDEDRAQLYFDLILNSVSEAAREVLLETMRPFKYEYQSDFVKGYVAQGRAEGLAQGRVAVLTRQLTARFGVLSVDVLERLASSSIEELDAIGDQLLTAVSLEAALAPKS